MVDMPLKKQTQPKPNSFARVQLTHSKLKGEVPKYLDRENDSLTQLEDDFD